MKKLSQDIALNHSLRSQLEVEEREISQKIRDLNNKIKETRQQKRELEQKNEDVKKLRAVMSKFCRSKRVYFPCLIFLCKNRVDLGMVMK